MNIFEGILEARKRIRNYIRETPLIYSSFLSNICSGNVFLKLESEQVTGSFKARGAFNKLLSLGKNCKGVVTASTGNHGLAVGYSARTLGLKSLVFVPQNISDFKLKRLRELGIRAKFFGNDCVETEYFAREFAKKKGMEYISPYNDLQIIEGQGTIGVEIKEQIENIDSVLVPVGGGGLISGVSVFLKSINKNIKIFGCLPENSPVMMESVKKGRIVKMKTKETLSDATAGGIEEGAITFEICKEYVDDFFTLSEEEIERALFLIYENHNKMIEGAGGLPVATILKYRNCFKDQNVVLIISGSGIDSKFFEEKRSGKKIN